MNSVTIQTENASITRYYSVDDLIWNLEQEKRERKTLADTQRDIIKYTDKRTTEQVVVRG